MYLLNVLNDLTTNSNLFNQIKNTKYFLNLLFTSKKNIIYFLRKIYAFNFLYSLS